MNPSSIPIARKPKKGRDTAFDLWQDHHLFKLQTLSLQPRFSSSCSSASCKIMTKMPFFESAWLTLASLSPKTSYLLLFSFCCWINLVLIGFLFSSNSLNIKQKKRIPIFPHPFIFKPKITITYKWKKRKFFFHQYYRAKKIIFSSSFFIYQDLSAISLFSRLSQSYYQVLIKLYRKSYKTTRVTLTQFKELKVKEQHKRKSLNTRDSWKGLWKVRKDAESFQHQARGWNEWKKFNII